MHKEHQGHTIVGLCPWETDVKLIYHNNTKDFHRFLLHYTCIFGKKPLHMWQFFNVFDNINLFYHFFNYQDFIVTVFNLIRLNKLNLFDVNYSFSIMVFN